VRNRRRVEPIASDTRTLAEVYRGKLERYRHYRRGLAADMLQKLFSPEPARPGTMRAATLLRANKEQLVAAVARSLSLERYSIHQILRMLIDRCEARHLYVRGARRDALRHVRWMLERLARLYAQGETPHLAL
jgi:hypothetical protein